MKKIAKNCKRLDLLPVEKLRSLPAEAKRESDRFYRSQNNVRTTRKGKPVIKAASKIFRIFSK